MKAKFNIGDKVYLQLGSDLYDSTNYYRGKVISIELEDRYGKKTFKYKVQTIRYYDKKVHCVYDHCMSLDIKEYITKKYENEKKYIEQRFNKIISNIDKFMKDCAFLG